MMMQVAGRKRWKAISPLQNHWMYNNIGVFSEVDAENPDYGKYPLYHNVQVLEFDLHPGEAIFMPVGWWHHVRSLDICISMSFTNFVFDNGFNFL
jgi:ribosomal protein L16 Arg81 hydroxylase